MSNRLWGDSGHSPSVQCAKCAKCAGVHSAPTVKSCDGDWRFDSQNSCLLWSIDLVDDSNRSGAMEAVVASAPPPSFFPCTASFSATTTMCELDVPQCSHSQTQAPVRFALKKSLQVSKFEVLY